MTDSTPPGQAEMSAPEAYRLGVFLFQAGNLSAAADTLERARQRLSGRDAAECDVLLARICLDQCNAEAAARHLARLPEQLDHATAGWALYVRARLQIVADPMQAAELIQQAKDRFDNPEFAAACVLEWAHAAQAFGRLEDALEAYRRVGEYHAGTEDFLHTALAAYGEAQTLILLAQQLEPDSSQEKEFIELAFERSVVALADLQRRAGDLPDHHSREMWRRSVDSAFEQALRIAADGLEDATRVAELIERAVAGGVYVIGDSTLITSARTRLPAAFGSTGVGIGPPPRLGWAPGPDGTVRMLVAAGPSNEVPWIPTW